MINLREWQRNAKGEVEKKPPCDCPACRAGRNGGGVFIVPLDVPLREGDIEAMLLGMVLAHGRALRDKHEEKDKNPT